MCKLPAPTEGSVDWSEFFISTPTFNLSPIEKPDMSPFLIHMTGKEEILAILKGENSDDDIPDGYGFLKSSVPVGKGDYSASVVCFTESPTFVVDFFRYRKKERWEEDQRFGIGFSKEALVGVGVRPALYLSKEAQGLVMGGNNFIPLKDPRSYSNKLHCLASKLYPLMVPLGEGFGLQGFMWEREWRYPKEEGLKFSLDAIKVICCPDEEKESIQEVLGDHARGVHFVKAWDEYHEVTVFLKDKESQWREKVSNLSTTNDLDELENLKAEHQLALLSLNNYGSTIENLQRQLASVVDKKEQLEGVLKQIEDRIKARLFPDPEAIVSCVECGRRETRSKFKTIWERDDAEVIDVCWPCYLGKAYPENQVECFYCRRKKALGELKIFNDLSYPRIDVICRECADSIEDS